MSTYTEIKACRVGGGNDLVTVLNLGHQALTGVFPMSSSEAVTVGPLELVWCPSSGLLQLKHSYDAAEMYGDNYGYRSGLNQSMVNHLSDKVAYLERLAAVKSGDVIVDIGSNDATTLKAYATSGLRRIGIDPTGKKFSEYYPDDIALVPDFFSAEAYRSVERKQAKIVTSIAMFYDLESPIAFARQIASILADDGIWHFEQSYMPSMLRTNSYDTICHEHLEYYSLGVVDTILRAAGLQLVDVVMNGINGGSFACDRGTRRELLHHPEPRRHRLDARPGRAHGTEYTSSVSRLRGAGIPAPRGSDATRTLPERRRQEDTRIRRLHKGNVTLQFCGLTAKDIPAIAEVNVEKFGRVTPGTHIPIVSEAEAKAMRPDYFLVLPWHFKDGILRREKEYLASGGRFIFPFPEIEII
jgi:hypothetical protein